MIKKIKLINIEDMKDFQTLAFNLLGRKINELIERENSKLDSGECDGDYPYVSQRQGIVLTHKETCPVHTPPKGEEIFKKVADDWNKQANDLMNDTQSELEQRFHKVFTGAFYPELKDFISQEKQKSYEEGLAMGNKTKEIAINNIITDSNTARVGGYNQAIDEVVEKIKQTGKDWGDVGEVDKKYASDYLYKVLLSLKKPTE